EGTEQYKFIEHCLASVDRQKQPWLIFLAHRVLGYSSTSFYAVDGAFGEPMGRDSLQKLWQKYKVDIAIYGHAHSYERTCPIYESVCTSNEKHAYKGSKNGTIHVVAEGGGASLTNFANINATWSLVKYVDYGFLKLTVAGGGGASLTNFANINATWSLVKDMEYSSGEESELSETEIFEYKDKPCEQLRNGTYKVKYPNGILKCPFCAGKKKQNFKHKDLHQHASGVSKEDATIKIILKVEFCNGLRFQSLTGCDKRNVAAAAAGGGMNVANKMLNVLTLLKQSQTQALTVAEMEPSDTILTANAALLAESSKKNKVMVAIDDSEFSEYALTWALKMLGSTFVDSELLIYTARTPVDISYLYASSWGTAELIKELKESENKAAMDLLKKAKTTCTEYRITAEGIAEIGDPKVAICNAVEKLNVQLLIVGSHGRGALTRAFIGSVSNYCVSHAKYASEGIKAACNWAYKGVANDSVLRDEYFLSRLPIVNMRLAQGGVRLAATLNRIFE
nr:probable inactive purple acid phosphatase 1 [Tanacetum cinerariifolium]